MKNWLRIIIACAALILIGVSAYKLITINKDYTEGSNYYNSAAGQFVVHVTARPEPKETPSPRPKPTLKPGETPDPNITPEPEPLPPAPLTVDFDALKAVNSDVVGWLYCENTVINYPVVQGEDNEKYLRRLLDGTHNTAGTLFLDCRNAGDFSDFKNIIYGHHMRNDSMFGTLTDYKKQAYFDEHPTFWLLTPEKNYRLDLIAGCVTEGGDAETYSLPQSAEELREFVLAAMRNSTFNSNFDISALNNVIVLSTCSYEFNNARYVLIANMVPAGNAE